MAITDPSDATMAFIEFLKTPVSHEIMMAQGGFLTPHSGVNLATYETDTLRGQGEILLNATTFRFDGSDLMPGAIGAGSFWMQAAQMRRLWQTPSSKAGTRLNKIALGFGSACVSRADPIFDCADFSCASGKGTHVTNHASGIDHPDRGGGLRGLFLPLEPNS